MKLLFTAVLTLLAGIPGMARAQPLVLDRPSIVVVFRPDAEISAADRNSDGFGEFISDFDFYAASLASELRGRKDVAFIDSDATILEFNGKEHAPITRKDLSGFGFIVYVPGKPPTVFKGVATDTDVLCALHQLAPEIHLPVQC